MLGNQGEATHGPRVASSDSETLVERSGLVAGDVVRSLVSLSVSDVVEPLAAIVDCEARSVSKKAAGCAASPQTYWQDSTLQRY